MARSMKEKDKGSSMKDAHKNTVKIDPLPLPPLGHTPPLHADVLMPEIPRRMVTFYQTFNTIVNV